MNYVMGGGGESNSLGVGWRACHNGVQCDGAVLGLWGNDQLRLLALSQADCMIVSAYNVLQAAADAWSISRWNVHIQHARVCPQHPLDCVT